MILTEGDIVFGETAEDEFEIIRFVGSGAFGDVYKIARKSNQEVFALKTIRSEMLDPDATKALRNEGALAKNVLHENVIQVFFFHDGLLYEHLPLYMIMEYASSGTLAEQIQDRKQTGEMWDLGEIRSLFAQLASGMKAINEHLVHRDVKPDNILVSHDLLKISDFGLAKIVGEGTRTETFKGINHIMYCAPEAWLLDKNTPSMDMYSMGIVFYEIATLQIPYEVQSRGEIVEAWKNAHLTQVAPDPTEANHDLDLSISQLITKMIAKKSSDRYETWDDVLDRIENSGAEEESARDVSSLVKLASDAHQKEEQAKLKAVDDARKRREFEDIVAVAFDEVIDAADETVKIFNAQSEFANLELRRSGRFQFTIHKAGDTSRTVSVSIIPLEDLPTIRQLEIKAWGFAISPTETGFNLLLVAQSDDQIYGDWKTVYITHNPVAKRTDPRPDPFPLKFHEFRDLKAAITSMHIFKAEIREFQSDQFDMLIATLLD